MANRSRIRSGFRRPFMFRRKSRPKWLSDYWSNGISLNRLDYTQMVLLDYDDWEGTGTLIDRTGVLKRVMFNGTLRMHPQSVDGNIGPWSISLAWMCLIVDKDDADLPAITTAVRGSLLQSERVLQCGAVGWEYRQAVSGAAGFHDGTLLPLPNFSFNWRGGARLRPDQEVRLIWKPDWVGLNDSNPDDDLACFLAGYSRCLISPR